ncbi:uncharacterized protein LOC110056429 isoform X1 [Orbicella faveolata]|uniref:uncharacterized protein LOC110056429 isoform X1 n=1 Tax=Orbicella faveolata TaxID=48498 RepID=UPI0009E2A47C|nr:uncharacterized protein LOC110056429 isoform X1 [Orbicella faveolata]XP_020618567.1 uncharacterized protein LOC110056429 isoform X1 [Orbicella faveolata]
MKTLVIAFCVTFVVANSLAVLGKQAFMDDSQLSDGGTETRPRKGKRDPGLPIPQSEERDENTEPNKQTYFRDSPGGNTRPRKGKREPGLPIPQSEKPSRDEEKGHMWSDFDRQAKEIEKVLKDSQITRRTFQKRQENSHKRFQKRQAVTGKAKSVWEDFVDALQM